MTGVISGPGSAGGRVSVTMRPMHSQVEQAIASLALYRRLQPDDRAKLAAVSTLENFPRASLIFREGDLVADVPGAVGADHDAFHGQPCPFSRA